MILEYFYLFKIIELEKTWIYLAIVVCWRNGEGFYEILCMQCIVVYIRKGVYAIVQIVEIILTKETFQNILDSRYHG